MKARRIHYYDSSGHPSAATLAAASVFIKETAKQLQQRFHPSPDRIHFERRTDSSYAKQSDQTSCGFFVGYYFESYLTMQRSTGFFMGYADFMVQYRHRVARVLLSVADLNFPSFVPLSGYAGTYERAGWGEVARRIVEVATAPVAQASRHTSLNVTQRGLLRITVKR